MLVKRTFDGLVYSTHPTSRKTSKRIADHIRAVVGRIAKNKSMYRDEYAEIAAKCAKKFAGRNGIHMVLRSLDVTSEGRPSADCGYGRLLQSGWFEVSAYECNYREEDAECCLIEDNRHLPPFFRSVAHYRRFNDAARSDAGGEYSRPKMLRCETCGVIGSRRWVNYGNCYSNAYKVDGVDWGDLPKVQCLGCGSKSRAISKRLRDIHENGVTIRRIQREIGNERKKQRQQAPENNRGHAGVSC